MLPLSSLTPLPQSLLLFPLAGWWLAAGARAVSILNCINYQECRSDGNCLACPPKAVGGLGWVSPVKPLSILHPKHLHAPCAEMRNSPWPTLSAVPTLLFIASCSYALSLRPFAASLLKELGKLGHVMNEWVPLGKKSCNWGPMQGSILIHRLIGKKSIENWKTIIWKMKGHTKFYFPAKCFL